MCEQWKDSNTQIKWKKMGKYIWIDLVHICICLNRYRTGWLQSPSSRLHWCWLCWRCRWPEVYNWMDLCLLRCTYVLVFQEAKYCLLLYDGGRSDSRFFSSVEGTWLSKLGKDFNIIFKLILISLIINLLYYSARTRLTTTKPSTLIYIIITPKIR